jgi:thiol-disulfide isomerase/thioredoxin
MKIALVLSLFVFTSGAAFGIWDEGVRIPNICYDTVEGTQFCTNQNLGNVQVFVYNAGWCPPCNEEVSELSQIHKQFEGKAVTFASLSGEGFKHGTRPDKAFLEAWKKKHKIPFVVAGKYRDFGFEFEGPGSIPFTVIVDKKGNVAKKGFMSTNSIVSHVKRLLAE